MSVFMQANRSPDAIAWFQVLYNTVAAILVYPFIHPLAALIRRYVHGSEKSDYKLLSIDKKKQKNYLAALQDDISMLMKKIYKFNVHHLAIDQKILLDPDYTIAEKYYAEYLLKQQKFEEDYEILKTIEESLLRPLLQRLHRSNDKEDKNYLPYYQAISALMYSAKALDDSRHNFLDLHASTNLMVKERLQALKTQMVDLYLLYARIIDVGSCKEFRKQVEKQLAKMDHSNEMLMDLLGKHLHRQPMQSGELSGLLHFSSALYRSHHAFYQ